MSKEKQIDIIIDLLTDFDEMGFAPTTLVPNPEAYAINWKNKLTNALREYRKQSEWISVDERLPERCGYYLGCTYKGGILIAPFFPVFANDKPEFHYKIAYWMPLPEAPKMKGGAE